MRGRGQRQWSSLGCEQTNVGDRMFMIDGTIVYSATDLATAAGCEFAALRALDAKLGRATLDTAADAMLARTADLGDAHEARVLARYEEAFGPHVPGRSGGVADIARPAAYDVASLTAALDSTLAAIRDRADVVFQGSFFDGRFHGRSDFLVRVGETYAVHDTKLAKKAKVTALLQLAAYADQLESCGVAVADDVVLVLGDGAESVHPVADLIPVYRARRARLQQILDEHQGEVGPVAWNDPRYAACGRCDVCTAEVRAHRDVLLVANLRVTQRAHLRAEGVETIEALAGSSGPVEGISGSTLARLRQQAKLQVAQDGRAPLADGRPDVGAVVVATEALQVLPAPDAGDLFFDFEGDPLWVEDGSTDWGLEYLFGVVEADTGAFRPFWAHDRREEKQALLDFLAYVAQRRAAHPGLHIYHYAAYEKTALLRLVGRHGVGEEQVDELLRAGVLVDLYATVRQSIRVSQPSYSLKALEPLYMGDDLRTGVTNAADSVTEYAKACEARVSGDELERVRILDEIADYNCYDCRSTRRLRDWLRSMAAEAGVTWDAPMVAEVPDVVEVVPDAVEVALLERVGDGPRGARDADQQAHAMLAAALGYHRREQKPFWWAHFDRCAQPVDEWAGMRDVFLIETAQLESGWALEGRQRNPRRTLVLTGEWGAGSNPDIGKVFVLFDPPVPHGMAVPTGGIRGVSKANVVATWVDERGRDALRIIESRPADVDDYDTLPMALTPDGPPGTDNIATAIRSLAVRVVERGLVEQSGLDVLRRVSPRIPGGLPPLGVDDTIEAVTAAVLGLDHSYLAVQGPPGTGKTYVGSHVVRRLVEHGWRIGVVAQSHAVVENFLDAVVSAGVPASQVGKAAKHTEEPTWTDLVAADNLAGFLREHDGVGCVIGGTAWDLTNRGRVGSALLDLVVIDEAGQFSLANTLAVSTSATRLLLLGDPQQLPQVSQGVHPEPVDGSARGWLTAGHATLPRERGYFLEQSWRMHPALCARVSALSYDGELSSHEAVTGGRSLSSVPAGVHVSEVSHSGNSVESVEEAAVVVAQVRRILEGEWTSGEAAPRAMTAADVLVVAAYNAQVSLLRRTLVAAGFGEVRVGTVDKLQGQEAPVVIVSMAASSAADVPRGMEFLLSRNRINVAVSRGQWAAIVVRSPSLTDYLPTTPRGLGELGAFLRLTS